MERCLRRNGNPERAAPRSKPVVWNVGSSNRLIQGDNVEVLAQLPELRHAIRCIYIDPPYNTSERWTRYEDGLDHDDWLSARARTLEALWPFLRDDGSLWISINDAGLHYLKVLADKIFGRDKFISTIVWQHRTTRENRCAFSQNHEYLLATPRTPSCFEIAGTQSLREQRCLSATRTRTMTHVVRGSLSP